MENTRICNACKAEAMEAIKIPRFSRFFRVIGVVILVVCSAGIVLGFFMISYPGMEGIGLMVGSVFIAMSLPIGLVGILLLMKKKAFKCMLCGSIQSCIQGRVKSA